MPDLVSALQQFSVTASFRDGQQELVESVLNGHDLLAVMPTGSGKSLGFQLPALLLPGTTLVVSPLISLMKDQVDELNRRGIRAAALHSALSSDARRDAFSWRVPARAACCTWRRSDLRRSISSAHCGRFRSRASSSTKRIAYRSGVMTSGRTTAG